jgi:transcriptional regulator with XRE-family HTH domain
LVIASDAVLVYKDSDQLERSERFFMYDYLHLAQRRRGSERMYLSEVITSALAGGSWSTNKLAARSYLDVAYVSRLARGLKTNPSRDTIIKLGIALGKSVDEIDAILIECGSAPLIRSRQPVGTQR